MSKTTFNNSEPNEQKIIAEKEISENKSEVLSLKNMILTTKTNDYESLKVLASHIDTFKASGIMQETINYSTEESLNLASKLRTFITLTSKQTNIFNLEVSQSLKVLLAVIESSDEIKQKKEEEKTLLAEYYICEKVLYDFMAFFSTYATPIIICVLFLTIKDSNDYEGNINLKKELNLTTDNSNLIQNEFNTTTTEVFALHNTNEELNINQLLMIIIYLAPLMAMIIFKITFKLTGCIIGKEKLLHYYDKEQTRQKLINEYAQNS